MENQTNSEAAYASFVSKLVKSGVEIKEQLTPTEAHLVHMAMGVSGEAGELLDAVKKSCIYRKPLDITNVVEELGDLEFFMEGIRAALRITREEIIAANVEKLSARYPNISYSNEAAIARADKV